MNKKHKIALASGVCCIAVLSFSVITYFNHRNAPDTSLIADTAVPLASMPEISSSASETKNVEVPAIKVEAPEVIAEPTEENAINPSADTIEKKDENGNTVQTHDWEAQKELAAGTDIHDPDKVPEYVAPSGSTPNTPASQPSGGNNGGTPNPGDTKTIDGSTYTYVPGFGWVKNGSGNVRTEENVTLSGEKVGY